MCGIIGAVCERNVIPILLEGLRLLEYRGYDSSGLAVIHDGRLTRERVSGKVAELQQRVGARAMAPATTGIAHTRWATHGRPTRDNAHPHVSGERIAVVHNGILENFTELRNELAEHGYAFCSDTDTEVIAHAIFHAAGSASDLLEAVRSSIGQFEGAYALGIIDISQPGRLIAVRKGSPLVIGIGLGEYFIASDAPALSPVTHSYIALEEGDIADIRLGQIAIYDRHHQIVFDSADEASESRPVRVLQQSSQLIGKGEYRHYMLKEIFEQPQAVVDVIQNVVGEASLSGDCFGYRSDLLFERIRGVVILACGTSYHAGLVARYWFEDIIGIPVSVEIASEFCYRNPVIKKRMLYVTISQSGETADTIAALKRVVDVRGAKPEDYPILSICNCPDTSLNRMADLSFLTHAGVEVGVASTKSMTAQMVSMALLLIAVGKAQKRIGAEQEELVISGLRRLPALISRALSHEPLIAEVARQLSEFSSVLFLGRGVMYPIAMEGALKFKEISYIHAEAYAAGELKHGPLALVDEKVPVVVVAPNDELLLKLKSNLQEVSSRGAQLFVFEDEHSNVKSDAAMSVIPITSGVGRITSPIIFNIPLQLLAYHTALIRGTDIDQPRNLAKSVTVE